MEDLTFSYSEVPITMMLQEGFQTGIIQRHFKQLGFGDFEVNLVLDSDALHAKECEGNYAMFVVRRDDNNEMVGYLGFCLSPHMHHGDKSAQAHALWLEPEYRNMYVATALLQFAESKLFHNHDCRFVQLTSNTNIPIGDWIKKQGYTETDVVYTKQFIKG